MVGVLDEPQVDALDLHALSPLSTEIALGADADAWFVALDGRAIWVGTETCIARVMGIHEVGSTLWIQLSLFDDSLPGVVLQVDATHTLHDALDSLQSYALTNTPVEVIRVAPSTRH
jgi:hypothetical protein